MAEFEHSLSKTEVTWGLVSVTGIREHLPPPGERVVVYDEQQREYITKMHSSAARIDGLTEWYKNHPSAKIGDIVQIAINPDKSITLSLKGETQPRAEDATSDNFSTIEIVPSMERLLEDFLEGNLDHIENGLRLYRDESGVPGRQYPTDVGIIDLLCVDKNEEFVVIEIKKEKGSDKTVGQVTRYMGWVRQNLAVDKPVRGIIIVHDVDNALEFSVSVVNKVEIKYYKIDLKFVRKQELE